MNKNKKRVFIIILITSILSFLLLFMFRRSIHYKTHIYFAIPLGDKEDELTITTSLERGYIPGIPRLFRFYDDIAIYNPNTNEIMVYNNAGKIKDKISMSFEGPDILLTGVGLCGNDYIYITINRNLLYKFLNDGDDESEEIFFNLYKTNNFTKNNKIILNQGDEFSLEGTLQFGDLKCVSTDKIKLGENIYYIEDGILKYLEDEDKLVGKHILTDKTDNKITYINDKTEEKLVYTFNSDVFNFSSCKFIDVINKQIVCLSKNNGSPSLLKDNYINTYDLNYISQDGTVVKKYFNIIDFIYYKEGLIILTLNDSGNVWEVRFVN